MLYATEENHQFDDAFDLDTSQLAWKSFSIEQKSSIVQF